LENFVTAQPIDDTLATFAQKLSDRCSPQLSALTFTSAKFGLRAIADVAQIYARQPLTALAIAGLDPQHLQPFLQELAGARNLRSLTLDHIADFPLKQLFPRLETLETLALIHCNIDIPLFLKTAGRSKSFTVRSLNLSGNDATPGFGSTFSFPPSVRKIVLNAVAFNRDAFAAAIRYCLASTAVTSLSMQNVSLAGADLERACKSVVGRPDFRGARLAVQEVFWDNNTVTPSLLELLERCPELRLLSLNGSLAGGDQSIRLLSEFLACNATLHELRICGTMQRSLASWQIAKLLESLKTYNRTILRIDLSHNVFDQKSFDEISDLLLKNRVIARVEFQNFRMPELVPLETFLKRVVGRGAPLEIPLPRVDLEEMQRNGALGAETLRRLLALFGKIAAGDPTVAIPPETRQAVGQPPAPSYRSAPEAEDTPSAAAQEFVPGPDEWKVACEPVPPVDNSTILAEFQEEFAIDQLIVKVKGAG
jgi:hypothetical protein